MDTKIYKGYLQEPTTGFAEFARARVQSDAPALGGALIPALDYTWSVSDDGGRTFRNPSAEEQENLYLLCRRMCRDCGLTDRDEDPVGFGCGHIAHPSCHAEDGGLACRYKSADPEVRHPLPHTDPDGWETDPPGYAI